MSFSSNINSNYNVDTYEQLINDFDKFYSKITIETYQAMISILDEEFMQSKTRKELYHSKGFVTKTILTKFGFIKLTRRRYVDKSNGSSYMFIDRFLGLSKYSRMDPFVIAELVEEAACNSYSKAANIVSKSIGNKIKYNGDLNKFIISRATARNNVIKAVSIIKNPENEDYKEIDTLNIMLDEKFVGSQFNNKKDYMIKAAVIFEDTTLEYKNRVKLTGKHTLASLDNDLLKQILDYVYYNYDTDKLKVINFMGDGASWIKSFALDSSFKYHKNLTIHYGLDHFHLAQAIQHIVTNKYKDQFSSILMDYIISDKQKDFITICNSIIELNKNRTETIETKMKYIINNWDHIQTTFKKIKYKCSMESNISHAFADIFTSRPKAYSKNGLNSLLKIRLLKVNNYDLKKLYFNSLKTLNQNKKESKLIDRLYEKTNNKNAKYFDAINHSIIVPYLSLSNSYL